MLIMIIRRLIGGHFCEETQGRDGHGHSSESKEILQFNVKMIFLEIINSVLVQNLELFGRNKKT